MHQIHYYDCTVLILLVAYWNFSFFFWGGGGGVSNFPINIKWQIAYYSHVYVDFIDLRSFLYNVEIQRLERHAMRSLFPPMWAESLSNDTLTVGDIIYLRWQTKTGLCREERVIFWDDDGNREHLPDWLITQGTAALSAEQTIRVVFAPTISSYLD